MKTNLLKAVALAIVMTSLCNCSVEPIEPIEPELEIVTSADQQSFDATSCDGQDPKSRVTNDSNNIVNFEIHDVNGVLVNYVYGLEPGEISEWKTFPVGTTTFTVSTSESSKPVTIDMGQCMAYDVTINENNQLDSDTPTQL